MVVKEDGSKWACQSCLKGHRVSGCNHTDRELTLVPKKGRPVTQCQHCRLERKKRSAHVKCDCGEAEKPHHSKEKCIHLREAEERAKAGLHDDHHIKQEEDPAHLVAVAEEQGCCCYHGGKCSCSLVKKEPQSKGTSPPHGPAVHKPRLETAKSDGSITVFANGHHKPVHRKNHAAHECGMPYKMPPARPQSERGLSDIARRSVDSLPLDGGQIYTAAALFSQTQRPTIKERRQSKSEQTSPKWAGISNSNVALSDEANLSAIDFNDLQTGTYLPPRSHEQIASSMYDPMSGMPDGTYDLWSALPSADSLPNNNPFGAWPTIYDSATQPALTIASSGTQSEIDEVPAMEDFSGLPLPGIQGGVSSTVADSNLVGYNNANRRSLPPNFFGNADFNMASRPYDWPTSMSSVHESEEGKPKAISGEQTFPSFESWSTPTMPSMQVIAQRTAGVTSHSGRPQTYTADPSSAPNEDLISQLFPGIDVNTSVFGSSDSPMEDGSSRNQLKRTDGLPTSRTVPAAMNISTMDDTAGFIPQAWSDGSVSVPNDDAFTTAYSMDLDFHESNMNGDWQYQ